MHALIIILPPSKTMLIGPTWENNLEQQDFFNWVIDISFGLDVLPCNSSYTLSIIVTSDYLNDMQHDAMLM